MEARAYVYVYVLPPTVQYIQVFLPAKPPLRKGLTREMTHSRGYTQGYQTDFSNRWLCKIGLSLIVEQPWSEYETLYHRYFLSSCPFYFHSTLLLSPVTQCSPHPQLSEGMFYCMRSHKSVASGLFESNLIAFIMVIIICNLAVGLHNYIFWFVFLSLFCVFVEFLWF